MFIVQTLNFFLWSIIPLVNNILPLSRIAVAEPHQPPPATGHHHQATQGDLWRSHWSSLRWGQVTSEILFFFYYYFIFINKEMKGCFRWTSASVLILKGNIGYPSLFSLISTGALLPHCLIIAFANNSTSFMHVGIMQSFWRYWASHRGRFLWLQEAYIQPH